MGSKSLYRFRKLLFGSFILLSSLACAEIKEGTYSMATFEQVPYGFLHKDGQIRGSLFEIMNEIIATSGLRATNRLLPSKRLFAELNNGAQTCALLADSPLVLEYFDLLEFRLEENKLRPNINRIKFLDIFRKLYLK